MILTVLILLPLVGALVTAFVPAAVARLVGLGFAAATLVAGIVAADAVRRRRRHAAHRDPHLDRVARRPLRPRRRRPRPADGAAHRRPGADRAAGRLARVGGAGQQRREGVLRLDPRPRGDVAGGLHRHRRAALLRRVRGHADPGVLPHRRLRPGRPWPCRDQVPHLPARRRADHARLGDRALRRLRQRGQPELPASATWPRSTSTRSPSAGCSSASSSPSRSRRRCSRSTPGWPTRPRRRPPAPRCCWSASSTRSARSACCGSASGCCPTPRSGRRRS